MEKSRTKMPIGLQAHDELLELYDLDVKRRDLVDIPAIPMTEHMRIKGYKRRMGDPKPADEVLIAFAEKLDDGLKEELLAIVGDMGEQEEPKEEPKEDVSAEVLAAIASLGENVQALTEKLETPAEPAPEAEPSEVEEEAEAEMSEEALAETVETINELTALAETNQLDEEGLETLIELSSLVEAQVEVPPSA